MNPISYPDSTQSALYRAVERCLLATDAAEKVRLTRALRARWQQGELVISPQSEFDAVDHPGRPPLPRLVDPRNLPRRSVHTPEGHAALIHAITHIEFNAINLALDAVHRFRQMPTDYIDDWLKVADEEAYHFQLMREHLQTMGYDYGDFDAHNGLWEMAQATAHDVLVRMALVPRVMEARGLDVTPGIIKRLQKIKDSGAVEVLEIILHDEIGHVEIGTRWFHHLCDCQNLPRDETFEQLFAQYTRGRSQAPLHRQARIQAGFTAAELDFLEGQSKKVNKTWPGSTAANMSNNRKRM